MISTMNPAFQFLREHKNVPEEVEALVMKKTRGRISQNELMTVFENGVSGKYGKLYSADAQTLMGWIEEYEKSKNSAVNYLDGSLLPVTASTREDYDWAKEANKCYKAFLNGVSFEYFHHGVYMRMVLDDKIKIGSLYKYEKLNPKQDEQVGWTEELKMAARKVLRDTFLDYKSRGSEFIYFIR